MPRQRRQTSEQNSDFDGAWKEALRQHFAKFIAIYFPKVGKLIDWSHPLEWLDKEISRVVSRVKSKNRSVDVLVRVRLLNGESQRILVHLEIQSSREQGFEWRLTRYNGGLVYSQDERVVTLVILGDLDPKWCPDEDRFQFGEFLSHHRFPVCKLVNRLAEDWKEDWSLPVIVARAQIEAQQTAGDPEGRAKAKWRLVRRLYDLGLTKNEVRELFALIDWMMRLQPPLEIEFARKLSKFEKEQEMPYVTSIERLAEERGEFRGRLQTTIQFFTNRFGKLPPRLQSRLESSSGETLELLGDALADLQSIADLKTWLADHDQSKS